jgi:Ca-activated chloride channel homolog
MRSLGLIALFTALPLAASADPGAGLFAPDGRALPVLESDAELVVTGDIVSARVVQTFRNDGESALSARYVFPLPHDAAVHAMVLDVAGVKIQGQIQRVEEAQRTFAKAKSEGKTAALLEEHRANIFSQEVANIPPGEAVRVEIEYAAAVPREDGVYRLHFPTVVGARYSNGKNGVAVPALSTPLPKGMTHQEDPRARGVVNTAPRVSIKARLFTGAAIRSLRSPSHQVEVRDLGADRREVDLAAGRAVDDRDFVLEYRLASERVAAGMVIHEDDRGAFASVLVEPPMSVADREARARELVFVIDASCSMSGRPLAASKELIDRLLTTARPNDTYRVVVFGSTAAELSKAPLHPTVENLAKTRADLKRLDTMGGTEIELGIKAALSPEIEPDRMRIVLFLTDAYIGDEASVIATIEQHKKAARIFAFGIGDSVNRYLIEEMAIAGRGVARIVGLGEDPEPVVEDLAKRLATPFLSDAWIDWGDLAVTDASPSGTFDLFAGAPVRVLARMPKGVKAEKLRATIVGSVAGKEVRVPIDVRRLEAGEKSGAIPVLWARAQVADRMRGLSKIATRRDPSGSEEKHLVGEITQLGLDYHLTTRWTAFVAVSERTVATPDDGTTEVALGQPNGVSAGEAGSSTPEPAAWAAMILLGLGVVWTLTRKNRPYDRTV